MPLQNADTTLSFGGFGLIAIRKDLGNDKTQLKEIDMLRGQIKDIDQYYNTQ